MNPACKALKGCPPFNSTPCMMKSRKQLQSVDIDLSKYIDNSDHVRLNRRFNNEESHLSGFILEMSEQFILIQIHEEFLLDGYAIVRKDQVHSYRCNLTDRTQKKILQNEGVLDTQLGISTKIDLSTWQTIFRSLRNADFHVIIECEALQDPDFIIGPVKRIDKHGVKINFYDSAGRLLKFLTYVPYDQITVVKFDNRYTTVFKKYLKQKPSVK